MVSKNSIQRTLQFKASRKEVWDLLTNPSKTKLYMYNCEVCTDWNVGSKIKWKGNFNGYESGEKGIILSCIENECLKYSSIDPTFGIEDIPENYLHITYDLEELDDHTRMTVTIENFNKNPERLIHIGNSWDRIVMPAIKDVLK